MPHSYELMAEPQRDITPEQAAARLRASGGILYRHTLKESAGGRDSSETKQLA